MSQKRFLYTAILLLMIGVGFLVHYIRHNNFLYDPTNPENLKSLPYSTWHYVGDEVKDNGVVKALNNKIAPGFNFYHSAHTRDVYLADLGGNIVHTWNSRYLKDHEMVNHVRLEPNGDVFVLVEDRRLVKLDKNSKVLWSKKFKVHHDIDIGPNGDLYTLERQGEYLAKYDMKVPVLVDYLLILTPEGKLKKEISLLKPVLDRVTKSQMRRIKTWAEKLESHKKGTGGDGPDPIFLRHDTPADILHANSVDVLDKDIEGVGNKGDVLVSIRELNLIGVLDPESESWRWTWGPGEIEKQHQPILIDNNNILLFDNGSDRGYSRVIEFDPRSKDIEWEYKGTPPKSFFSRYQGGCQKLDNGNVLIVESMKGHVFEVTTTGEIVWEFYNPAVKKESKERAGIYRMRRVQKPPFLSVE